MCIFYLLCVFLYYTFLFVFSSLSHICMSLCLSLCTSLFHVLLKWKHWWWWSLLNLVCIQVGHISGSEYFWNARSAVQIFTMHLEYPGLYEELSCRLHPGTLRLISSESYACLYYVLCCRRKSGANNLDITLAWRGRWWCSGDGRWWWKLPRWPARRGWLVVLRWTVIDGPGLNVGTAIVAYMGN